SVTVGYRIPWFRAREWDRNIRRLRRALPARDLPAVLQRLIIAPRNLRNNLLALRRDQHAEPDGRRERRLACRRSFRRAFIVAAAGLADQVHLIVALFVGLVFNGRFERSEKAGEVPARGRIAARKNFVDQRRARGKPIDRSDEIERECIGELRTDFDRRHADPSIVYWLLV